MGRRMGERVAGVTRHPARVRDLAAACIGFLARCAIDEGAHGDWPWFLGALAGMGFAAWWPRLVDRTGHQACGWRSRPSASVHATLAAHPRDGAT